MRPGLLRGAALATALASCLSAAYPAATDPLPSPALVETTTSELVLIEVYVRDGHGRPVRDLKPEDFILKIDQQVHPKTITSLEWVEPPSPAASGEAPRPRVPSPANGAAGTAATGAAAERPSPSRHEWARRFLLFFDDYSSTYIHMTQARNAAIKFLARPGQATDQFAIVTYDEARKLTVLHEFSSDRADLTRTLQASLKDSVRMSEYDSQRESHMEDLRRIAIEGGRGAGFTATSFASEDSGKMARILNLARSLVDGLAAWPGYKAMVYIGDGIPESPAQEYGVEAGNLSLTAEIGGLALAAGGSNVTLHSVQTTGLVAGSPGEAGAASRRANVLKTLALDTGGVADITNDLTGAFAKIEASAEGYYVLAYVPEGPPDGRSHSVNLKLRSRILDLRYRRFFTRFTPSQARARAVEAAFIAPELHPDLALDLVAVTGAVTGHERFADLVVYVPSGKVLFLPDKQGAAARLEVGLVALDADKKEILRLARTVRVSGDARRTSGAARPAGGGALALDLYARVKLPAAGATVTAVVADDASGTIGSARVQVAASAAQRPEAEGLSLYAVDEESLWVEVESGDATRKDLETAASRTIGPALRTRFAPGERIACGFRMSGGASAIAPRDLLLEVLKGEAVVRSHSVPITAGPMGHPANPAGSLSAEVPLAGLADGDYLLRLAASGDPGTVEIGRLPFRIVSRDGP